MRYKVLKYNPDPVNFHVVQPIGHEYTENMDLMIGPSLHERGIKPQDLVGKEIEVEGKHVYMYMAMDLEIIE